MRPALAGELTLAVHLAVIAFNVLGLAAIPLGAWRGWPWVRARLWRSVHLASWALVAAQAILGRACILTIWQDQLEGSAPQPPLIERWVNGLIYWPLPMWAFGALYLALFAAALAFWFLPATRPARR
jgi:hypothetical protein